MMEPNSAPPYNYQRPQIPSSDLQNGFEQYMTSIPKYNLPNTPQFYSQPSQYPPPPLYPNQSSFYSPDAESDIGAYSTQTSNFYKNEPLPPPTRRESEFRKQPRTRENFDDELYRVNSFYDPTRISPSVKNWMSRCRSIAMDSAQTETIKEYIKDQIARAGANLYQIDLDYWEKAPLPYWLLYSVAPKEYNLDHILRVLGPVELARFVPKRLASSGMDEGSGTVKSLGEPANEDKTLKADFFREANLKITAYVKKLLYKKNLERAAFKLVCKSASQRLFQIFCQKYKNTEWSKIDAKRFLRSRKRKVKIERLIEKTIALMAKNKKF